MANAIVGVVLNVSALPSLVSLVPVLEFRGPAASSFVPQSLPLSASDGSALPYTAGLTVAAGASWLTLGGAGGSTPTTVSAQVNASGLAPGYYVGYISVQSVGARNSLLVPAPADRAASSLTTLAVDQITPNVTIGGATVQVLFAGLAPGFAGLSQVDVVVPSGLPSGPATLPSCNCISPHRRLNL